MGAPGTALEDPAALRLRPPDLVPSGTGRTRVQACTDVAAEFGPIERTQPIGGGLPGGGG